MNLTYLALMEIIELESNCTGIERNWSKVEHQKWNNFIKLEFRAQSIPYS